MTNYLDDDPLAWYHDDDGPSPSYHQEKAKREETDKKELEYLKKIYENKQNRKIRKPLELIVIGASGALVAAFWVSIYQFFRHGEIYPSSYQTLGLAAAGALCSTLMLNHTEKKQHQKYL